MEKIEEKATGPQIERSETDRHHFLQRVRQTDTTPFGEIQTVITAFGE